MGLHDVQVLLFFANYIEIIINLITGNFRVFDSKKIFWQKNTLPNRFISIADLVYFKEEKNDLKISCKLLLTQAVAFHPLVAKMSVDVMGLWHPQSPLVLQRAPDLA